MENKPFYDGVGLLEEARRYKTSQRFLELFYDSFKGSRRLFSVGTGPRLLTVSSAIPEELRCLDVNQGSIDRAKQFIDSWRCYIGEEPFKTEFDFLEQKGIKPRFDNCQFYLGRMPNGFPLQLTRTLDGVLASELFLHLTNPEIIGILEIGKQNLRQDGKFFLTVYTSGHPDSLDSKFYELGAGLGIRKEEFIREGVINIKKLNRRLKEKGEVAEKTRREFWLDLEQIRVFDVTDIERWIKESELSISAKEDIRCGMFPFAYRLVYVLKK